MKTFKEYRKEKEEKKKLPAMETSYGKHSLPKKLPAMETSFGNHSKEKKPITESSVDSTGFNPHKRPRSEHERIHTDVAPMDLKKTSNTELASVVDYTDDSWHLNTMLRNHYDDANHDKAHIPQAKELESVLNKHKTNEDVHVYTGVKESPAKHFKPVGGKLPVHSDVHLPAFTSTTTDVRQAFGFAQGTRHHNDSDHGIDIPSGEEARHILKLHLPKGTSAMSVRDHAMLPEENEILMNRGHNVRIHRTPTQINPNTYLWHGEVIGHDPKKLD